jgi:hypothetical protein
MNWALRQLMPWAWRRLSPKSLLLSNPQGLNRESFAIHRQLWWQLRRPLIYLEAKGIQQAFGIRYPTAGLSQGC